MTAVLVGVLVGFLVAGLPVYVARCCCGHRLWYHSIDGRSCPACDPPKAKVVRDA